MKTKWQMHCMNSFVDGVIINDFEDDKEAAQYAANYEATCYRIDPDGSRTMIYSPYPIHQGKDPNTGASSRVSDFSQ